MSLHEQLGLLRTEHGIETVLCEGGPTLNGGLLRDGLVDELFVTMAPLLAAGDEIRMVEGDALSAPAELELRSVLQHESELLLRYRVG
jgi:5-amino-6-(5-phosphoribosylamino)uracil reductase